VYVVYIGTNSLYSASIGKLNLSNAEHRDPDRSAQPARHLPSSDFAGIRMASSLLNLEADIVMPSLSSTTVSSDQPGRPEPPPNSSS
jgi:hypothetical protein